MAFVLLSLSSLALFPCLLCFSLIGFDLFQHRLLPINDGGQSIRQDLTDTPAHLLQLVKTGLHRFELGGLRWIFSMRTVPPGAVSHQAGERPRIFSASGTPG